MLTRNLKYIVPAALVIGLFFLLRTYRLERALRIQAESNVAALREDTTEKSAVIMLERGRFAELFAEKDAELQELGYRLKNVRQAHFIKYVYTHADSARTDTIVKYVPAPAQPDYPLTYYWQFDHGECITHVVTYTEGDEYAHDTALVNAAITRVVVSVKPKWYKMINPKNWWRSNWPTQTEVRNNCGFEVQENTVYEIK